MIAPQRSQVVDGLEQRNDVDARRPRPGAQQAGLASAARATSSRSDTDSALRDHVVRHRRVRRGAVRAALPRRRSRARAATLGEYSTYGERSGRGPASSRREQRHALAFVERGVVGPTPAARKQLGDDRLVHVRVLAQVDRREVEAEHAAPRGAALAAGRARAAPAPCAAQRRARSTSRSAANSPGVAYGGSVDRRRGGAARIGRAPRRSRRAAHRCRSARGGRARRARCGERRRTHRASASDRCRRAHQCAPRARARAERVHLSR